MTGRRPGWVLGIDLGTTNTAAVAFSPERPEPISILHGRNQSILPSVVSLENADLPLVGWLAKDMLLTNPLTTVFGWKRFIGRKEQSAYVARYRDRFPYRIHADPNGELGAVVHGRIYSFIDIAAMVLDQVRLQTNATTRQDVRECVISVPAHFDRAQRAAVREAAQRARLELVQLVNEPTAAALAFGVDQRLDSRILVFDLGGGTFDTTILELVDNVFDVKATRGEGFLGGVDFDRAITQRLIELCKAKHRIDPTEEPVVAQRLLFAAENAKCALSTETATRIRIPMIGHDQRGKQIDLDYKLTREELEQLTAPLVERTTGIVEETLASAGLHARTLDHVIIVGGQSRMPLVKTRIAETLGREPLTHLDPDTCIALGAALMARGREALDGAVLLDVLSVPIGIVFPGGRTQFLFETNTSLPSRTRVPIVPPDGTQGMAIGVWQGADLASPERHVLGVVRIPRNLFAVGSAFAIDFVLRENLDLEATFLSAAGSIPLFLDLPGRSPSGSA